MPEGEGDYGDEVTGSGPAGPPLGPVTLTGHPPPPYHSTVRRAGAYRITASLTRPLNLDQHLGTSTSPITVFGPESQGPLRSP